MLCCDSKGLFLQKKKNQFLEMPALYFLTMWLEIWNWNIMVKIFIRTHLGMRGGKRMWWSHKASPLHSQFRNQASVWVTNIAQSITLVSIIGIWAEVRQLLSEMARQGQTDLFKRGGFPMVCLPSLSPPTPLSNSSDLYLMPAPLN